VVRNGPSIGATVRHDHPCRDGARVEAALAGDARGKPPISVDRAEQALPSTISLFSSMTTS
jgi:hypothetical protein